MRNQFIILALIAVQFVSAQSPWTKEKGKAYVQLGYTGLFYDKMIFDNKEVTLNENYKDNTLQLYSEYGITNKLEAQLIIPFKIVGYTSKVGAISENLSGIGNISLGLKYKIHDKKWKLSTGLLFTANSIKKEEEKNLTTGLNANTLLPYITLGSSNGKWYYFAKLGYGYMDNEYSDFLNGTLELGYEIIKNGHLILVLDSRNVISKEKAFENEPNQWPSYLDRQEYLAFGIKGNYEFKEVDLGVNFAVYGATAIDNSPLAPTLNVGIYKKF